MRRIASGASLAWVVALVVAGLGASARDPSAKGAPTRLGDQEALRQFGPLVGAWKGTGQVRRGSNQGAWTESSDWAWKLAADSARLEIQVAKGKYLRSATLAPVEGKPGAFTLDAVLLDGSKRLFRSEPGQAGDSTKPVAFRAEGAGEGVRRISLATPNEARFLLTYESIAAPDAPPTRLGEVGSTRVGVSFAAGESGPVCIVTGGRGTIQVSHAGKSYWVCCSGCRDLFNDDPAAVLAAAAQKAVPKP